MNLKATLSVIVAACLCGCVHPLAVNMRPPVFYVSEAGDKFEARYGSLSDGSLCFVKVRMPDGQEYTLPQVLSASGVRYTDERTVVWWEHQGTIRVDVRDQDGQWKEDAYPGVREAGPPRERRATQAQAVVRAVGVHCEKVELNLESLDPSGLRGPVGGKVAVSYEFAIPNTDECKAQVMAIDPTVQFMPGSQGRIQAGKTGCLCIGSTHQPSYRQVLRNLAELPYVQRIVECHFE